MATYQARLGAMKMPSGTASTKSDRLLADRGLGFDAVGNPAQRVLGRAENSHHGAARRLWERPPATVPARVAAQDPDDYSAARYSERSAARLAHQSGGLGVPSSNLGAPTILPGRDRCPPAAAVDQPAAGDELVQHEPQRRLRPPCPVERTAVVGSARHDRRFASLGRSRARRRAARTDEQVRLRARFGNVFDETPRARHSRQAAAAARRRRARRSARRPSLRRAGCAARREWCSPRRRASGARRAADRRRRDGNSAGRRRASSA